MNTKYIYRSNEYSIHFGFRIFEFSFKNIEKFCTSILHMHYPKISDYTDEDGQIHLSIRDNRLDRLIYLVQFIQGPVQSDRYLVRLTITDKETGLQVTEEVDYKEFMKILTRRFAMPVYIYTLEKDHSVGMLKTDYGVYGIEGIVNHEYIPYEVDGIKNSIWLKTERILRDSLAHVWFYERNDELAITLLQNTITRKERIRRLKKQSKRRSLPPRASHRKDSRQLHKAFMFCGGSDRVATRLRNMLARAFDIYNLSDMRINPPSPNELALCRHIGPKSLDVYTKTLDLIRKLPNAK